ncbi:MAG: protein-glutamate O-methyltransferase CheR, partial [Sphingomonadales bacterium]|nr:protein-glutamate O-methyltransferase CheR [Sphingomonadales bacterium]
MNNDDFEYLRALLHKQSGLVVNPEKVYLLESRLTPLARRLGMDGLDALVTKVRATNDKSLVTEITEAMTTNESFFFRDKTPFDNLKNVVLPHLKKVRADRKRIRIWCAAASSGQEPYSIALTFKENAAEWAGWNIEIVATDICNKVLNKAQDGEYSQFEVQRGLPVTLMMKYFEQKGDVWKISDEIRKMVTFKYLNLLHPFAGMGVFDVIFCRNVLIYFDQAT